MYLCTYGLQRIKIAVSDWSKILSRSDCMLWGFFTMAEVFKIFYICWQTLVLLTKSASTSKCRKNPYQDLNLGLQIRKFRD